METLLVIDDDKELCELLQEYLGGEGYSIESVNDGLEGSQVAISGKYDLIVLDVMLPGQNGFEVLKEIRKSSVIPVIMLTAKGDEIDRILGLEMGADDYLPKPFSPRELLARIKAILRRGQSSGNTDRLSVGDLTLVSSSRMLLLKDIPVEVTSMEFRLMEKLFRSAGKLISREDLFLNVLERGYSPFDRSLDMHISNLRKKLGPHPDGSDRIRTIRGEGYLYAFPMEYS